MAATSFSLGFCFIPLWQLFHAIFHSSWHSFRSDFHFFMAATSFSHGLFLISFWQLCYVIFHSSWHSFSFLHGSYFICLIPLWQLFHVIFHCFLAVISIIFSFLQGSYFILPCFQGSSNGSSRGWSHDLLPKMMKKMNIVVLHCSFCNLFQLCFEVLPLWRYQAKGFSHHWLFFLVFCIFLFENNTK